MSLSRFDEAAKSFLELLADVVDIRSPASSVGVYYGFHLFVFCFFIPSKPSFHPSLSTENLSRSRACDITGHSTDLILEKELTE